MKKMAKKDEQSASKGDKIAGKDLWNKNFVKVQHTIYFFIDNINESSFGNVQNIPRPFTLHVHLFFDICINVIHFDRKYNCKLSENKYHQVDVTTFGFHDNVRRECTTKYLSETTARRGNVDDRKASRMQPSKRRMRRIGQRPINA